MLNSKFNFTVIKLLGNGTPLSCLLIAWQRGARFDNCREPSAPQRNQIHLEISVTKHEMRTVNNLAPPPLPPEAIFYGQCPNYWNRLSCDALSGSWPADHIPELQKVNQSRVEVPTVPGGMLGPWEGCHVWPHVPRTCQPTIWAAGKLTCSLTTNQINKQEPRCFHSMAWRLYAFLMFLLIYLSVSFIHDLICCCLYALP